LRIDLRRICRAPLPVTVGVYASRSSGGNALGDALVRPGRVVMHPVAGQDAEQVLLAGNKYAAEEDTTAI
jgi:hypothetical protein